MSTPRTRRSRPAGPPIGPKRQAGAALLVLAMLFGHLGGAVHHATVVHSRCAEHGELIHGGGAAAGSSASGLEAWAQRIGRDDRSASAEGAGDSPRAEHEHCLIDCASHERARPLERAVAMTTAQLDADLSPLPPAADRTPAAALYRTAPKTSPPA